MEGDKPAIAAKVQKLVVCRDTTLHSFDIHNECVILLLDTSMQRLGTALSEMEKPVAFVSKVLTPVEQHYVNTVYEQSTFVFGADTFTPVCLDTRSLRSLIISHLNRPNRRTLQILQYTHITCCCAFKIRCHYNILPWQGIAPRRHTFKL